jgi:hypothetical protein
MPIQREGMVLLLYEFLSKVAREGYIFRRIGLLFYFDRRLYFPTG